MLDKRAFAIAVMGIFIRLLVTIFLVLVVLGHIFDAISLDVIDILVFVIIVFLWFAPTFTKYIETFEFGGAKVTFNKQLKDVQEKIENADLKADPSKTTMPSYLQIATSDPNLALAGLRIEIEKQLRSLAEERDLAGEQRNRPPSVSQLMDRLYHQEVITPTERSALSDLVALLNRAVHGAEVDENAASWAFDVGPQIIAALEQKHLPPRNSK